MHKRFWVELDPYDSQLLTAAIEAGADAVVLPDGYHEQARRLGRITTVCGEGDLQWHRDVRRVRITRQEDEQAVRPDRLNIIDSGDWTIIPLENLLAAQRGEVIQTVHNAEEARIALQVMERGADGILLQSRDAAEIRRTAAVVQALASPPLALEAVTVSKVRPVGMSDRCCIDATSLLPPGEGLLVGNSADALFLIHNENVATPYCAARPFRVNAGAVHAYTLLPGNRTRYLAELRSGDPLLSCDPEGNTRRLVVGRNKIERRPMLLVSAEAANGHKVSLILQNAETVRLTAPDGSALPVTTLQAGDKVLATLLPAQGRHFGQALDESIQEQ